MTHPDGGCTGMINGIMSGKIMFVIRVVCLDLLHMISVAQ